ncbi:MAG: Heat shock protein HtpX / FIG017973: domain of unknown function [uncultured Microvirga sp.]|uniref:Peptidase M48 domain-containing protein n=1 Tax=uncultured Microvirga sp. TaxID=412392 RepID=A0A6J4KL75_9HYPH|nr:MAG: Heat shock protein HtpX / FIG017973: domain of unknown function [uncultured Microvirga sp.]
MLRVNGFYGHVRRNDLRSLAMFAGFAVAFQIVAAVAVFPLLLFRDFRHAPFVSFGYFERYVPIVFVFGVAFFVVSFLRHVASVRATVDFGYVERRTDPRLVNIVETLAIAAGLPPPKVGLIESPARNAFACGLSPASAVVVVTRGLVDALDDDELSAVIAHEIAHIKNGDIRLMAAANVLMENLALVERKSLMRGVGWKTALLVVVMPALLLLFGAAGFFKRVAFTIARASRLLISSSREFVADAEAVRLTHNPAALISALRRIEGRSLVPGLSPQADAMMIDGAVDGPLATHPTIAERIAVLARLSGSLLGEADAPRKDTRTAVRQKSPASGPWGSMAPADPAPAPAGSPARLLIQRVSAGPQENIYGLTPGAKRVVGVGLAVLIFSQFYTIANFSGFQVRQDAKTRPDLPQAARPAGGGSGTIGGLAEPLKLRGTFGTEPQRIAALDPQEARCFATDRYRVGDRGLYALDGSPVGKGGHAPPDIAMGRYLGAKADAVRRVATAADDALGPALLAYVENRQLMLKVAHRFFGEPGLRTMQDSYASPADRTVLDLLRQKLAAGDPTLHADPATVARIKLLLAAPAEFAPCQARRWTG